MICTTCGQETYHIKMTLRGVVCHNCGGFSETSGVRVDGTSSRNSFRVREQQQHFEGDMIQPRMYDSTTRSNIPNPEFIKLYPDKAKNFFSPAELRKGGMNKLAKQVEADTKPRKADPDVKFKGNTKKAIAKLVGKNGH